MTDNQKTTDLLQKAKTTESDLLSGSELSDIIGTGTHLGTKQTKIIKGRLVMSITSILAVAATAAYLAFSPAEKPEIEKTAIYHAQKTEQVQTIEKAEPTQTEIIADNKTDNSTEDLAMLNAPNETSNTESANFGIEKVNVDGINIINIQTEEDYNRLGIYKKDGNLKLLAFRNIDFPEMTFPVINLINENGKAKIKQSITEKLNVVSKVSPQLITDAQGKKLLSLFDSGDIKMMAKADVVQFENSNKSMLDVNINSYSESPTDSENPGFLLMLQKMVDSGQIDSIPNDLKFALEDVNPGEEKDVSDAYNKLMKSIISKQIQQKLFVQLEGRDLPIEGVLKAIEEMPDFAEADKLKKSLSTRKTITLTELPDDVVSYLLKDQPSLKEQLEAIASMMPEFEVKVGKDSLDIGYCEMFLGSLDSDSDTSAVRMRFSNSYTYKVASDSNDIDKENLGEVLQNIDSFIDSPEYKKFDDFDDARLNKMLAIAIRLDKTADKPDFILWYDISPELIDALPQQYKDKLAPEMSALTEGDYCSSKSMAGEDTYCDVWRACNGGLQEMKIYPVPVDQDFTVEYTLSENRSLDFKIHDLYGEEVATLKTNIKRGSGVQSETFNVNLPSGMYLLSITSDKGEHTVQRFVIK